MARSSIKIVGASGQGLISIGEVLAKAFKRTGYCVFGYREYNSLIKGGHGSYQIDISDVEVRSSEEQVNVLVCLNHHGFEHNLHDVKDGGMIIHDTPSWQFPAEDVEYLQTHQIVVLFLPVGEVLGLLKAKPVLGNMVFSAFLWAAFCGDQKLLKSLVTEKFAKKPDVLELNMQVIDQGFMLCASMQCSLAIPKPSKAWQQHLLLTGSQAMGMGIVSAGCRLFAGYPMTPASPLLQYIADVQNETGMVIKQAEDEITAAQMVSGAMFAGTRAITATSGGGFDLMSETLSLNGIIENPSVFVLAQRPGPATGLPTWTAQGDLLMAVHTAHGEFARCVMSVSDSDDAFHLMNEAFNVAEMIQSPVIVLTDKHIAEGIYTQRPYDAKKTKIARGRLVTKSSDLKKLKSTDRYDPSTVDGISSRWLPGADAATFCAQGDEHSGDGTVDESAANAIAQMDKRMKKMETLKLLIPDPEFFMLSQTGMAVSPKDQQTELLIVGWGSNKGVIFDSIEALNSDPALAMHPPIGYLHYSYLWPLKTDRLIRLATQTKKVVFIECSYQSQFLQLVKQEVPGFTAEVIRKYDGRPFFLNELCSLIKKQLSPAA